MFIGYLLGMVYWCCNDKWWMMIFVSNGVKELIGYMLVELEYSWMVDFVSLVYLDDWVWVVCEI